MHRVPLTFQLEDKQQQYVDKHLAEFVLPAQHRHAHTHPLLAYERACAESWAVGAIHRIRPDARILDIGGNPSRHYTALAAGDVRRQSVHCCCPILDAQDAVRAVKRVGNFCARAAPHTPAVAKHGACSCIEYTDLLLVHSIYYLDPEAIAELLLSARERVDTPTVTSCHHLFDIAGELAMGEAQYSLRSTGHDSTPNVCMSVCGNTTPYVHPLPTWLAGGSWCGRSADGAPVALAWATERVIGSTHIVRFVLVDPSLYSGAGATARISKNPQEEDSDRQRTLEQICRHTTEPGLRDYTVGFRGRDPISPLFSGERTTRLKIVCSSTHLAICGAPGDCLDPIPKQVVDEVALWVAGRQRTQKTYEVALAKARDVASKLNWDRRVLSSAIVAAANLGFVLHAEREIQAMGQLWAADSKMATLNRLLLWQWPTDWLQILWRRLKYATAAVLAIGVANWMIVDPQKYGPQTGPVYLLKTATTAATYVSLAGGLGFLAYYYVQSDEASNPGSSGTARGVVLDRAREVVSTSVCFAGRALKAVDPRCFFVRKEQQVVCKPSPGNYAYGPGCARLRPVVARSCTCNSELAIRNRVTLETPPSQDASWEHFQEFVLRYYHDLYPGANIPDDYIRRLALWEQGRLDHRIEPVPFDEWVTSGNWTAAKTQLLRETRIKLMSGPIDWPAVVKILGFTKRENISKQKDGGIEEYDPRAISGRTPEYQVLTGPVTAAHSRFLKTEWGLPADGGLRPITMAPGLDAKQIGVWLDRAIQLMSFADPRPQAVEVDEGRYDAKQVKSMEFEVKLGQNRIKPRYKTQLTALSHKLETKPMYMKGCKALVYRRRQSGDGDTTAGNSELNGLKSLYTFKECLAKWYGVNRTRLEPADKARVELWMGQNPEWADTLCAFPCVVLVAGDDMYAVTTPIIAEAIRAFGEQESAALGFVSKIKVHVDPRAGEFCSGWFCRASTLEGEIVTVLTPKPGRTVTRAMYSIDERPDPRKWVAGVAVGLASNYQHVPGVSRFYRVTAAHFGGSDTPILDRHNFSISSQDRLLTCLETWVDIGNRYGHDEHAWERIWGKLCDNVVRGCDLDDDICLTLAERDLEAPEPSCELILKQQ